jgi:hypothetical protein
MGAMKHNWVAPKKKESGASAKRKRLQELYPTYRDDELDVMMTVISAKELDEHDRLAGKDTK